MQTRLQSNSSSINMSVSHSILKDVQQQRSNTVAGYLQNMAENTVSNTLPDFQTHMNCEQIHLFHPLKYESNLNLSCVALE